MNENLVYMFEEMNKAKLNRKWYERIEITDADIDAHNLYMETPIDWYMNGEPISRRRAGWKDDVVTFTAGVQYARSL